jgi:hypothetical protein
MSSCHSRGTSRSRSTSFSVNLEDYWDCLLEYPCYRSLSSFTTLHLDSSAILSERSSIEMIKQAFCMSNAHLNRKIKAQAQQDLISFVNYCFNRSELNDRF